MNAWIEQYLRAWTTGRQNQWAVLLPTVEFAHNSWRHDVTRKSPHELLIGIKPAVHIKFLDESVPSTTDRIKLLAEARTAAQSNLEQLQQKRDNRKAMEMKIGNTVWLEGKNLGLRGTQKLLPK